MKYRKLSKVPKQRKNMIRNMTDLLITHERMKTTKAKALELRRHAEKAVYIAKLGNSSARAHLSKMLRSQYAVNKAIENLAPRYKNLNGGVVRVKFLGRRKPDSAEIATIEFVGNEKEIAEKNSIKEEQKLNGRPNFYEFSKNIAKDEIRYCQKAIESIRQKLDQLRNSKGNNEETKQISRYEKNYMRTIKRLEEKIVKAENDLEILNKNENHRLFTNIDEKYSVPIYEKSQI